jgi:hypothetical protein
VSASNGELTRRAATMLFGMGIGTTIFGRSAAGRTNESGSLPPDSGIIDVRRFGAVGDGIADDTNAVLHAVAQVPAYRKDHPFQTRIVYFPAGTYRVSDTILRKSADGSFQPNLVLIGEDRATTIIKLSDRATGFGDKARPKAVIYTSSGLLFLNDPRDGGRDYTNKGEGNEAFGNTVENLTIDMGIGNPGAVGIDFLANNLGAVRNVTIRAPSQSSVGLSIARKWPGPALISDVTITGFDIGIDIAYFEYSITLDKVRIEGSTSYGLRNASCIVTFCDLQIVAQDGYGMANVAPNGLVVGIKGLLTGQGTGALVNSGSINFTDVIAKDFKIANGDIVNARLDGVFQAEKKLSDPKWQLQVRSPPEPEPGRIDEWVNIQRFGAIADQGIDSTAAFAAAFNSNARVIYIPTGQYNVSQPFLVGDNIERIEGMFSTINIGNDRHPVVGIPSPLFRTSATRNKALFIRRLIVEKRGTMSTIVNHHSSATLVMSDIVGSLGTWLLYRAAEGGPVFAENTATGHIRVSGRAGAWFRQLNAEGPTIRISNSGAPLWILGATTEQTNTLVQSTDGANTEVVGALIYRVFGTATETPAFVNKDGRLVLSYAEEATRPEAIYSIHLDSWIGDRHTVIRAEDLPRRGKFARMAPSLSTDDLPH